ncbi:hypothetical protein Cgig2_020519 [Carnegiea gigantea]|uniref:2-hydroxyflavanone C-glucosyltransferase n=1 Tax=Carnegiea gigantea TaxID=171969 RepID=A0A9Q1KBU9_9CARY|nr:hypothetical protein Cgig2_020519 [Carnegiea gigantea]
MVCENLGETKGINEIIIKQEITKKIVIMVPYPAQGHVTPMLKLASHMSTLGSFQPLIVLPEFIHRRLISKMNLTRAGIQCVAIPDGLDEGKPCDFFTIETAMEDCMPAHLSRLIKKLQDDDDQEEVGCLIVDVLASWAMEVGRECGVEVAGFWTAMVAAYSLISSFPELIQRGLVSDAGLPQHEGKMTFHPDQPTVNIEDLPWLIGTEAAKKARFKFWVRTIQRSRSLKWILANSFPNESQREESRNCGPIICPVGPLRSDGLNESPTFWEEDRSCLGWLDRQKPNSVVYISFGSWVSPMDEAKVRSLALTLEGLRRPFIWVLGPAWRDGLPNGYPERVENFGKIVGWAPQVDVLQHEAVGCYLTHCGWNSTMEAVQCKKNLLCFPVAGDQSLNCEYIVNVWKIGVKINGFSIKDVGDGIKRVMEDTKMKTRIERLNERIMGEEATLKVKQNMLHFMNDLKRPIDQLQMNL